jgi:predicted Zn-dependent protease
VLLAAARDLNDGAAVRRHGEAVLAREPGDQAVRLLLARQYQNDGDRPAALRVLEPLAAQIDSAPDGTALLIGQLRVEAGHSRDAVPLLRDHLAHHPGDADARRLLAGALRDTGADDEAARLLRPLRPDAAARAEKSLASGGTALDAGRLEEARAALEEARSWAPDDDAVLFLLARTRARQGARDAAIGILEESLTARYDRPWAVGFLGQLAASAGQGERATALAARYRALTGHDWTPTGD